MLTSSASGPLQARIGWMTMTSHWHTRFSTSASKSADGRLCSSLIALEAWCARKPWTSATRDRTWRASQQVRLASSLWARPKLRIYCFYEALKMNDTVGKVVERESTILPAYDNCSINADHRTMTKFTGRADAGYSQVRGVLERWIKEYESSRSVVSPPESESTTESSGRGGDLYNGPVFNGTISGRYVIPGAHTTGGTVNFNFPSWTGWSSPIEGAGSAPPTYADEREQPS